MINRSIYLWFLHYGCVRNDLLTFCPWWYSASQVTGEESFEADWRSYVEIIKPTLWIWLAVSSYPKNMSHWWSSSLWLKDVERCWKYMFGTITTPSFLGHPSIHMRCHGHCDFHRFPGQLPSACSVQANGPVGFCAHWCSPSKILGVSIRKFIFTMFYLSWSIFFSISTMTTSHLFKHSAGAPSPYVWLSISPQNHQLHLGRSAMHALAPAITDRSWRTKSRRQNVDTVDTYMAKPEDTRQKTTPV